MIELEDNRLQAGARLILSTFSMPIRSLFCAQ